MRTRDGIQLGADSTATVEIGPDTTFISEHGDCIALDKTETNALLDALLAAKKAGNL